MNLITIAGSDALAAEYEAGASLPDLAKFYGISVSTIRRRIIRAGGSIRGKSEAAKLAVENGSYSRRKVGARNYTPEFCKKISDHRKAWWAERAKGTRINSNGYMEYTQGDMEGRLVHVVEMEKRIGRRILPDEVVHHIDGNRSNNESDNLALMTSSGHSRMHRLQEAMDGRAPLRSQDGKFRSKSE